MTSTHCIWCLNSSGGRHVEHIVPEVLGCPPKFTLPEEVVCQSCNNGLGHLDQAVADDFDFVSFQADIPRKKGRPPVISGRGNVYGFTGLNGPEIIFNMGPNPIVTASGSSIAAFRGSERNVKPRFTREGSYTRVSFQVTFGQSKKFHRGIYKIALSALAYFVGADELLKPKYNQLRQYVRKGTGTRHFLVFAETDSSNYRFFSSPSG